MTENKLDALASAIGDTVSRETFERLTLFEGLFRKWSARINLAAPSTIDDLWSRHIIDSAQLLRFGQAAERWIDLGSGGGFPGAVLAILLQDRGARVTLVESNKKKAAFLSTVLGDVAPRSAIVCRRIEEAGRSPDPQDIVTARALAPLPKLLGLAAPWLRGGATGLFHKGRDYRAEIAESRNMWAFDLVEHTSVAADDSVILGISNLKGLRMARGADSPGSDGTR